MADITISKSDLTDVIRGAVSAAVQESRKPYVSEADKAQAAQRQEQRKQSASTQKEILENKFAGQLICTHTRRDGSARAVFVNDDLGGYLVCQKCQAVIRQGQPPKNYKGSAHYNTELFTKLFQATAPMFD